MIALPRFFPIKNAAPAVNQLMYQLVKPNKVVKFNFTLTLMIENNIRNCNIGFIVVTCYWIIRT